jgi:type IV pilus assembly protein PilB
MNDETPTSPAPENTSNIKDEDQFQDAIIASRERATPTDLHARYAPLADQIHQALAKQDSDAALTMVTTGALGYGSSDIHYDTLEGEVHIRLRIDGELITIVTLSRPEYKLLLERLKYKSDLKLNLTEIPQDGKYRIVTDDERIDVRVSTLPVRYGENVVCRILDSTRAIPTVDDLGFMWTSKRQIDRSLKKKNGTILVT